MTTDHLSNGFFLSLFQSVVAMTWAHQDRDRPPRIGDRRIEYGRLLKERLQEEEGMRKKAEE